jgi:hypothetical protein
MEFPIACPTGTYGPGEGLGAESECAPCYGGRFCEAWGLADVEGVCDLRFYCVENANVANPRSEFVLDKGGECPSGGFCPSSSKFPRPCRAGYYHNASFPITNMNECVECPAGSYCDGSPNEARTDILNTIVIANLPAADPTGECEAGYYCTGHATHGRQYIALPG